MLDIKQDATAARGNAQDAFNAAWDARNRSDAVSKSVTEATERIWSMLNEDQPTPVMVRDLAEEVLRKNIHLRPDEIKELADKIKDIVGSLTDSDRILADTANDRKNAHDLETRAKKAKEAALEKQTQAGKVRIFILNRTPFNGPRSHGILIVVIRDLVNLINIFFLFFFAGR